MKITHAKVAPTVKRYEDYNELKPNAFYLDADGCLVVTDCNGSAIMVVTDEEVMGSDCISWPLEDTTIKKLTLEL